MSTSFFTPSPQSKSDSQYCSRFDVLRGHDQRFVHHTIWSHWPTQVFSQLVLINDQPQLKNRRMFGYSSLWKQSLHVWVFASSDDRVKTHFNFTCPNTLYSFLFSPTETATNTGTVIHVVTTVGDGQHWHCINQKGKVEEFLPKTIDDIYRTRQHYCKKEHPNDPPHVFDRGDSQRQGAVISNGNKDTVQQTPQRKKKTEQFWIVQHKRHVSKEDKDKASSSIFDKLTDLKTKHWQRN